jgi:hypothetical protein
MAEIIGAAKGIMTIIQLAGKVIDYIEDTKSANTERNKLLLEICTTKDVLVKLHSTANGAEWNATVELLSDPTGPLEQFQSVLELLESTLKPAQGKLKKFGDTMTWHFAKSKVNEALSMIERLKALFMLALNNDQM